MREIKKINKEQTYGWYPSVRDIYHSKNQPTPYHLECLYKFKDSGYYNPICNPPEPAFIIQAITPSPPPSRPVTARTSSRQSAPPGKNRPKSVPVPKFRPVPKMGPIPTPKWKHKLRETEWGYVSTPDSDSGHTPRPTTATFQQAEDEAKPQAPAVEWPTQQILGKYDKPHVTIVTPTAEDVFGTPLPPRQPGTGGDSGYVFIPTGDGGVEVHSPPNIEWPDSHPRPASPQHSVSSRASMGSTEGMAARLKMESEFKQQQQQAQDDKRQRQERQRRFEYILRLQQQRQQQQQQQQSPAPPRSATSDRGTPSPRKDRVQSAVQHRRKPPVPPRPAHSARPSRPASDTALYGKQQSTTPTLCLPKTPRTPMPAPPPGPTPEAWREHQGHGPSPQPRPVNPLPPTPSEEDLDIEEDRSSSPDYEAIVDKYGWRAEVHGDPYNIKKTTKRLPYTVKCVEPGLAPEPPKIHMESKDTFFLNTIPRRRATFDVAQDWMSEGLHAQRIELQKREGVNYRYKTFSFAY